MKKVDQRYMHQPEKGIHGDCWAACISSITEIPLEELPDANDPEHQSYKEWPVYWCAMLDYLKTKGFSLYNTGINNFKNIDFPVIAVGKSPRGDFNHAVVWQNGIIHDPHPDRTGIHSIVDFMVIEKI